MKKGQYVNTLLEALEPSEQQLLIRKDILTVLVKDNDDDKGIKRRGIYKLIRKKLGKGAIERLNERLSNTGNALYSTVKAIYIPLFLEGAKIGLFLANGRLRGLWKGIYQPRNVAI